MLNSKRFINDLYFGKEKFWIFPLGFVSKKASAGQTVYSE